MLQSQSQALTLATGQVQQLLMVGKGKEKEKAKGAFAPQEMEEATPLLLQSFQQLDKILQSLTGDQVILFSDSMCVTEREINKTCSLR